MVRSATGFIDKLKSYRAVISAGDNGSCTVWKDDEGKYRCEFTRYMVTKDAQTFTSLRGVRGWLRDWMPKQN